jgi:G3E family GTPase
MKLHDFMVKVFVLQQPDWSRLMGQAGIDSSLEDESIGGTAGASKSAGAISSTTPSHTTTAAADGAKAEGGSQSVQQLQAAAASRRAALEATFGVLLRSKGFVWVASRGDHIGEWSQAGSLLSFSTGVCRNREYLGICMLTRIRFAG